jgi:hypothetical protein
MGGATGQITGKSKIATYLAYVDLLEGYGETFQDCFPDPSQKKHCKREMVQDAKSGDWVLYFRLHT